MYGSDQDFDIPGITCVELAWKKPPPPLATSHSEAGKKSLEAISVGEQLAIILAKQVQTQQLFNKIQGLRARFTPPTTKATDPDRVLRDKKLLLLDYKLQESGVEILSTLLDTCRLAQLVTGPIYLPYNESELWLLGDGPDSHRAHVQAEEHDPEFIEYLRTQIINQTADTVMEAYEFRTMRNGYTRAFEKPDFFPPAAEDPAPLAPGACEVTKPAIDIWRVYEGARKHARTLPDTTKSKGEGSKSGGTACSVASTTSVGKESK